MQCIQFQKNYAADPNALSQHLMDHKKNCPECQWFADEVSKIDDSLVNAFKIEVPKYLNKSLLQIPEKQDKKAYYSGFVKFAMAATVILVVGMTFFLRSKPLYEPNSTQFVYEHISHEPEALAATEPVKHAVVRTTMSDFGIAFNSPVGKITHVRICPIGNTHGLHLVIEGKNGPVTLLFLPTLHINQKIPVQQYEFFGYITPAEVGSIAIIGGANEPLEKIETRVIEAIEWL